ncbi:MAG TPA: methionyl-tRNA formyltransferase [Mycobacteriales bacterium]|nr:methionyl-tRNA formyltransferase [Mycobacteriales bacterium]
MRLLFAGTPAAALPSLQALLAGPHDVVAVLTRPDAPAGRGRSVRASAVKAFAEAAGVPVLTPASPREPAFSDQLRELAPDCCPIVAYGALIPAHLLELPRHGWVNLHFSLLPAWRGAAPVQHAVLAGDETTGATTFRLEEGLDTGPVYGVTTEPIRPRDTAGELLERLATAGAGLLAATMDGLEDGSLIAVPQPADGVSLAPKVGTADARVDWAAPALRVDRLVRACTPAPGAWSTFRGERVKLGPVTMSPDRLAAGELHGDLVGTATTAVRLGSVQPAGRSAIAAADWLRGVRPAPGERWE